MPKSDAIKLKQLVVESIISDRMDLLQTLGAIQDRYNYLSDHRINSAESASDWFSAMPIESMTDFEKSNRQNKLSILKERAFLRKTAQKTFSDLAQLDSDLRVAKIDVLTEKINCVLKRKDEISSNRKRSTMASKR